MGTDHCASLDGMDQEKIREFYEWVRDTSGVRPEIFKAVTVNEDLTLTIHVHKTEKMRQWEAQGRAPEG